jgi:hypothetical protein
MSGKMELMLDRNLLSDLSRAFADSLFREFGEWEQFAELLPDSGDGGGGAMEVTIEQPGTDRAPRIRTDGGEITIGFDMWHTHVGKFMGISDSEAIELALADIRSIIAEESVIAVVHRNGKWAGSSLEDACDAVTATPGATTNVYSWRRTHDRVL